jgi:hypothetical protein
MRTNRTTSRGSLVISRGMWYWNRGQVGGRSALDYLIKVRGMGFVGAAMTVLGNLAAPVPFLREEIPPLRKAFALPYSTPLGWSATGNPPTAKTRSVL